MRCVREAVPGNYLIIFYLPLAGDPVLSAFCLQGFFPPVQPYHDQEDGYQRCPRGRVDDNDGVLQDIFGVAWRGGTGGRLSSRRRTLAGNRSPPLKYLTVTVALPEGTIASAGALIPAREGNRSVPVFLFIGNLQVPCIRIGFHIEIVCLYAEERSRLQGDLPGPVDRFVRKREDPDLRFRSCPA